MKHLLLTTIAAVLVVGCAVTQAPKPPTEKAPDIDIHQAATDGNIKAVKQHLAAGKDVNAKDFAGWTPLHRAAWKGHKVIAELLIAKGANENAKTNKYRWTPLHYAAIGGEKEVVELLIAKGANVNAKMVDGRTTLDAAIYGKNPETAELLRKHGGKTGEELKAEGK